MRALAPLLLAALALACAYTSAIPAPPYDGCDAGVSCFDGGTVFCRPYADDSGRQQPVCVLP